jgi:hypothetical protein
LVHRSFAKCLQQSIARGSSNEQQQQRQQQGQQLACRPTHLLMRELMHLLPPDMWPSYCFDLRLRMKEARHKKWLISLNEQNGHIHGKQAGQYSCNQQLQLTALHII